MMDPDILKLIADTVPVIILVLDTQGIIQHVNPYFEQLAGCRLDELKGKNWFTTFLPEPDQDRIRTLFLSAIHGDPARKHVNPIVTGSGEVRAIEWSKQAIRNEQGNVTSLLVIGQDISTYEQAEVEVHNSEAHLKDAQRMANVGSWELDLQTNKLIWSDEIYRLFEIDQDAFGATYEAFLGAIHPDDRNSVNQAYAASLSTRTPYEIIHQLLMRDGRIKWVEERCVTDFDADGKPLRSRGTVQDVTERTRTAELLKQSADEIEDLYNHAPCGYHSLDKDSVICRINDTELKWLGHTRDEVLGKMKWTDLLSPTSLPAFQEDFPRFKKQGFVRDFEIELVRKDGTVIVGLVNATAIYDSQGNYVMSRSTVFDITERKQTEAALRQAKRLLSSIVENIPVMVFVKRAEDLRFELFNRAGETLLGYSRSDLLGKNDNDFFPKEQADFFVAEDRKALASEAATEIPQEPIKTAGGETRYLRTWKIALRNEAGTPTHLLGISIDITDSKQTDESLRESDARMRAILDNAPYMAWLKDSKGRYMMVNKSYIEYIRPRNIQQVIGKTDFDIWPKELAEKYRAVDLEVINSRQQKHVEEQSLDGDRLHWVETVKSPIIDKNGNVLGTTGFSRDITERKKAEEKIRNLALYDTLTKLPNRRLLKEKLTYAIAACNRSGRYGALMFIDLDNFKPVNDMHGHIIGDLVLIEVARRIAHCVREVDTVARFGGDEFVVVLGELDIDKDSSVEQVAFIAERIRATLAETYVLTLHKNGKPEVTIEYHCTSSIGVVLFLKHEENQEEILKRADVAMYQAKEAGRNLVHFYNWKF